jgi:hypothetical protein
VYPINLGIKKRFAHGNRCAPVGIPGRLNGSYADFRDQSLQTVVGEVVDSKRDQSSVKLGAPNSNGYAPPPFFGVTLKNSWYVVPLSRLQSRMSDRPPDCGSSQKLPVVMRWRSLGFSTGRRLTGIPSLHSAGVSALLSTLVSFGSGRSWQERPGFSFYVLVRSFTAAPGVAMRLRMALAINTASPFAGSEPAQTSAASSPCWAINRWASRIAHAAGDADSMLVRLRAADDYLFGRSVHDVADKL